MATRLSRPLLRRVPATCPLTAPVTTSAAQLSSRTFASANERFDESLPRDFRRWLKAEVALLVCLAAAGAVGVHLYQNRSNAPVNQVERLVEAAKQSAQEEDREQALKHCLHAYDVVKRTNPKDRHLFELAFAIAAQYEDLERGAPATKYYLDALEHTSHEAKVAKRERNRVITLDRIAQSYMNRGHGETAERYFRQAISAYDQSRGRRAISKVSTSDRADLAALDREIAAVLFNYSQLMMADKRLDEAGNVLQRALRLARSSLLSEEHADLIKGAIATVQSAKAMETTRVEPDE
ncbi:unnamed protein product [Hyaloperonospora brassicae]|uniref:Tetratricopeptide repeat-like domain-containing protein n=1 Tax=Hyaloperonospora brassicae TaxID=162125 RepID=A0AAV0TER9_HYABA|nr:unnamed protein product [Hyaloperonospora brassicae]